MKISDRFILNLLDYNPKEIPTIMYELNRIGLVESDDYDKWCDDKHQESGKRRSKAAEHKFFKSLVTKARIKFNQSYDELLTPLQKSIGKMLGLNNNDLKFLALCMEVSKDDDLADIINQILRKTYLPNKPELLARFMEISIEEALELQKSRLFTLDLFAEQENDRASQGVPTLAKYSPLTRILRSNKTNEEELRGILFPTLMRDDNLDLKDFEHLKTEISDLQKILDSNQHGTNILLWGQAGSGKTQLVNVLSKLLGKTIIPIGEPVSENGTMFNYTNRLPSLNLALKVFENRKDIILLFDEAEDLFRPDSPLSERKISKVTINRLFETNTVPIIWTSNSIRGLDESNLRRFTYSVEFDIPPVETRERMWGKMNDKLSLGLSENDISRFGSKFDITASVITDASRLALRLNDKAPAENLERCVENISTMMNYGVKPKFNDTSLDLNLYTCDLINCSENITELVKVLTSTDAPIDWTMMIYGPSGTGKSNFARYLAHQMKLKFDLKKASDLMSPYVGETEQNIAKTFEYAKRHRHFLTIDEGDSFLRDREMASKSWETSQVNEILTQMEDSETPFVITTNLINDIDKAAMRRFTFKLKFDYLTRDQIKLACERYFSHNPSNKLLEIANLTVGDFNNVKRRRRFVTHTPIEDELFAELASKKKIKGRIGF